MKEMDDLRARIAQLTDAGDSLAVLFNSVATVISNNVNNATVLNELARSLSTEGVQFADSVNANTDGGEVTDADQEADAAGLEHALEVIKGIIARRAAREEGKQIRRRERDKRNVEAAKVEGEKGSAAKISASDKSSSSGSSKPETSAEKSARERREAAQPKPTTLPA